VVSTVYFDTSALVKHYISEVGSDWVRALLTHQAPTVFTSLLSNIEGVCTFARRQREGMLSAEDHRQLLTVFDYDFTYRYNILGVEPLVMDTARRMANQHPLRAYDAVQLATAWLLNQDLLNTGKLPLTFICADERLITVAHAEGLRTDNPNHHNLD
jgi:predicted nucleic acid-binding protein